MKLEAENILILFVGAIAGAVLLAVITPMVVTPIQKAIAGQ